MVAYQGGTPIQRTHYYPFGMAFAEGTTLEQGKQPYKYNGKELDQLHGLNLYDYSARYMDAAIGRFTTVDPLAEKYYSISPYAYVGNNPMRLTDPTGMYPDSGGLTDNREPEKSDWQKIIDQKERNAELARSGMGPLYISSNVDPTDIVTKDGKVIGHYQDGQNALYCAEPLAETIVTPTKTQIPNSYEPSEYFPMKSTKEGNSRTYRIGVELIQIIDFNREGAWKYSQAASGTGIAVEQGIVGSLVSLLSAAFGGVSVINGIVVTHNMNTICSAVGYAASLDSNKNGNVRMVIRKNLIGGNRGYQGPASSSVVATTTIYTENGAIIAIFPHSPE